MSESSTAAYAVPANDVAVIATDVMINAKRTTRLIRPIFLKAIYDHISETVIKLTKAADESKAMQTCDVRFDEIGVYGISVVAGAIWSCRLKGSSCRANDCDRQRHGKNQEPSLYLRLLKIMTPAVIATADTGMIDEKKPYCVKKL